MEDKATQAEDWYGHHGMLRAVKPGAFKTDAEKRQLAYSQGVIPMKDLKDGVTYYGSCRNAKEATWHADKSCFVYKRHKWGNTFDETIRPLELDDGFDLFFPMKEKA